MKNMITKLNNLMSEKRLTCLDLSKKTGIANTTLSTLLKGRTDKFDIVKLNKICEVLGCSLDYLMNDSITSIDEINPLTGKHMSKLEMGQRYKVINEATLLFNDESVSDEDKEKLMMALNDMFWKSKQKNKEKYAKSHSK